VGSLGSDWCQGNGVAELLESADMVALDVSSVERVEVINAELLAGTTLDRMR
jgi:hypothetical protein